MTLLLLAIAFLAIVHAFWEHTLLRRALTITDARVTANGELMRMLSLSRESVIRLTNQLDDETRLSRRRGKRRTKEAQAVNGIAVPEGEDVENDAPSEDNVSVDFRVTHLLGHHIPGGEMSVVE
jgi:hypothetical protein